MFKRNNDTTIHSIIGEDTAVTGNIDMKGNILIYGKVTGDILTKGMIRVAKKAVIHGNLKGGDLQIGGEVEGDIYATGKVILGDQSFLKGDVKAAQIVIEDGARFEGKCDMIHANSTAKPA